MSSKAGNSLVCVGALLLAGASMCVSAQSPPLSATPGRSGGEGGTSGPASVTIRPATKEQPMLETIVGQPRAAPTGTDPGSRCLALAWRDFSTIKEAPTQLVSASIVADAQGAPAICVLNGFVAPQVGFRIWLPLVSWNAKYLQTGCGGRCGDLLADQCEVQVQRGYACLSHDLGHKGTTYDNLWAIDNVPAEIDFGFRATHVASIAGKVLVEKYYGQAPKRSYFIGASTGGRQALIEVQRFPLDFDGVIAGIAVMTVPGTIRGAVLTGAAAVGGQVLFQEGKAVLTADELRRVNAAALARCDRADGLVDNIITDPRRCDFEPRSLQCAPAALGPCLTPRQVATLDDIYHVGFQKGSELAWIGAYVAQDGGAGRYLPRSANPYSYSYAWVFNDASNPDIRGFQAAGGKLIQYQGWSDEVINPLGAANYYESVERLVGSRAETQKFYRLFMIPGQSHIPGNVGAESIDYLLALEAWVEAGHAPDVLIGHKLKTIQRMLGPIVLASDLQPDNWLYSRPHYPYPVQARYRGRGDPDAAESFRPWDPVRQRWIK